MMNINTPGEISSKKRKLIFVSFSLLCLVSIVVCLIVNIAIDRQITWAKYPLFSVPFGWAVLLPLLTKKHRMVLLLCFLTLLILPYLYFISKITPVTDWFLPIGLPAAIAGIISCWLMFLLFRFVRINGWYKASVSVFWLGVIIAPVINYYVNIYLGEDPFKWHELLNNISCVIIAIVLLITGHRKSKSNQNKNQAIDNT